MRTTCQGKSGGSAPEELYLSMTECMPDTLKEPSGNAWWHSGMAPASQWGQGRVVMRACRQHTCQLRSISQCGRSP